MEMNPTKKILSHSYPGSLRTPPPPQSDIPSSKVTCCACNQTIAHKEPGREEVCFGNICGRCYGIMSTVCKKLDLLIPPIQATSPYSWLSWLEDPKQLVADSGDPKQQMANNGYVIPQMFCNCLKSLETGINRFIAPNEACAENA